MEQATLLTQCCMQSTTCLVQPPTNTTTSITTDGDRSELQILKNRKSEVEGNNSKDEREGGEVMMMTGAATEWEWGWGSGGGWLCEAPCSDCDYAWEDGGGSEMFIELDDVNDEVDGDLDDADAGADFGDFGF